MLKGSESFSYQNPEIFGNIDNSGRPLTKHVVLYDVMCCGQLWVRHMICGQTCDVLGSVRPSVCLSFCLTSHG